ncbi:MerR family transcriptional regulator [Streptomyces sp. NBRC 109706]|uniref:MerR family transcriptional regulator n=1 Tax=Streptomyces sp. NBRC 109706 TaxID=1550035 RepID=UPI000784D046
MRIGELATRAGVSVRSLRYYEERGLLTSIRSTSGQRHYTDHDVERVRFLQRLFAAGLSSRTITELLPCVDKPSAENSDIALERMTEERDRLSAHIAELIRTRDALDGLMAIARGYRETQQPKATAAQDTDTPRTVAPPDAPGRPSTHQSRVAISSSASASAKP